MAFGKSSDVSPEETIPNTSLPRAATERSRDAGLGLFFSDNFFA